MFMMTADAGREIIYFSRSHAGSADAVVVGNATGVAVLMRKFNRATHLSKYRLSNHF